MSRIRGVVLSLIAATFITGLLVLQPAKITQGYDLARMHQYYKSDFRSAILASDIPWWNPYTAMGRPFLADVETATLYPPNWLVIPFGVTTGIFLIIGLHLTLAIEGGRRLGERLGLTQNFSLIAGLSFALSGALLGRLQAGQLQVFCVICLWPWVCHAAVKLQDEIGPRTLVQMASWLAFSFLAGSPQILWCGLIIIGIFLLVRSSSVRAIPSLLLCLTASGVLAAGLSALQLLPFVELVQQGNRPLYTIDFATRAGEIGLSWLTLIVPPGSHLRIDGEFNLHGGAIFFILAAGAVIVARKDRNARALAVATIAGFIFALGGHTFVLPFLAAWIPGFAGVRYPSRYALGSILMMTLLATWWLEKAHRDKKIGRVILIGTLAAQGIALVTGLYSQATIYRVPAIPNNGYRLQEDLGIAKLSPDSAPPRVALPASIFTVDAGSQFGIGTVSGFNNPALSRTWNALYIIAGVTPPDFHRAEISDEVIVKSNARADYFNLSAVFSAPDNRIDFTPSPVPRTFVSFVATNVSNASEAVSMIRGGHDFVKTALVEKTLPGPMSSDPTMNGSATIAQFTPNRVAVDCRTPGPGLLVLAESWYPGWTATINGLVAGPVIPVNGWMRGVQIPAGASHVVFNYRPTHWWAGVMITAISVLVAFGLWRLPKFPWKTSDAISRPAADCDRGSSKQNGS